MKRFYQTEWQNIQFSDFAGISKTELPGAEFYNAYYRQLFQRYGGYDELDTSWRRDKKELADWIITQLMPGAQVLSVGCGLGYMEKCLYRHHGDDFEIHVSDYASDALTWLLQELPLNQIHLADDIDERLYDLIYLSAVDYAVPTKEMIDLLARQKEKIKQGGKCLVISASYLEEGVSLMKQIKAKGKDIIKALLSSIGFSRFDHGYFWGWQRTRTEYRELMREAGYSRIEDGFIETPNQRTYFITGFI